MTLSRAHLWTLTGFSVALATACYQSQSPSTAAGTMVRLCRSQTSLEPSPADSIQPQGKGSAGALKDALMRAERAQKNGDSREAARALAEARAIYDSLPAKSVFDPDEHGAISTTHQPACTAP